MIAGIGMLVAGLAFVGITYIYPKLVSVKIKGTYELWETNMRELDMGYRFVFNEVGPSETFICEIEKGKKPSEANWVSAGQVAWKIAGNEVHMMPSDSPDALGDDRGGMAGIWISPFRIFEIQKMVI